MVSPIQREHTETGAGEWSTAYLPMRMESGRSTTRVSSQSSLLDELGLDPEEFDWDDLGLCRGTVTSPDDDIFFDKYESDQESARSADEMCLRCPVIRQCFFEGA